MKIIISFIALIFSQYIFAQNYYSDISEKSKYNITVLFKNNEQKQYNNIRLGKLYTGMKLSFSVLPSLKPLNINKLKKQKLIIKLGKKEKIKISNDSINELIIQDADNKSVTYTFKNVTIKGFDDDLKLVTLAENILVPLRYSDNINIYGYKVITTDVYTEQKNGFSNSRVMPPMTAGIYYFLNHPNSNVVINPIDFSGGLFNTKLISDKFVATLKEIGKNCDEFVAQYENYNYAKVSKEKTKEYMKTYRKKAKAIKKRSKKLPRKERAAFLEKEYERVFMLDNFIKIIDYYNEKCDH